MTTINKVILGLLGMALMVACDEDDSQPNSQNPNAPVTVQFLADISLAENGGTKEIQIQFSKNAARDGMIILSVTTEFAESFHTVPAMEEAEIVLAVEKGDAAASFTMTPVDNTIREGSRSASFSVKEVSEGFTKGTKNTMQVTITDDETSENPVFAEFEISADSLMENLGNSKQVKIKFSQAAAAGKVIIRQTGDILYFLTSPVADINGVIELPVSEGTEETWFTITPRNDNLLKGHQSLSFEIRDSEGFEAGTRNLQTIKIIDDELRGKAKSFESFGGGWSAKQTYEYDELGRISKVHWENRTPGLSGGTYTYYYAANGLIEHVNHFEGKDVFYYQENGRIVRSEIIRHGEKQSYSLYDYDPAGNVGGKAEYYKQPNGEFIQTDIDIYLHYDNGNLFKHLSYYPAVGNGEPQLRSEKTYEQYLGLANPFPLMELLPNINSQPNWPATYQVKENGIDKLYYFTYEYNAQGQPVRRTVSGVSDVTNYTYY